MSEKCSCNSENKFLLFWIGVLTGALLVGIIFLYRLYIAEVGETNLFRMFFSKYRTPQVTTQTIKATSTAPTSIGDPQPW